MPALTPVVSWTDEHDAYCLKHGIRPAAKLLWQWLTRQQSETPELEPDLTDFNAWVEKHRGKGYCRQTLKDAIAQLVEHRIVQPIREFCWKIWRLILKPIALLLPPVLKPKNNLRNRKEICDPQPSNPQSADDSLNSSSISNIPNEEILEACNEAGIHYSPDKPAEVFRHSLEEVQMAIAVFRLRGGAEKVSNPEGWLIECLRWRWWEDLHVGRLQI